LAVVNYNDVKGQMPPAYQLGPDGQPQHSWRVLLLPYIEGDAIFKAYRFDEPWNGPHNGQLSERMPRTFTLSDAKHPTPTTNYLAVVGSETIWPGHESRKWGDIDSASETILIVENHGLNAHWMAPRDLDFATMSFTFNHPHGLSSRYSSPGVALVDGSVRSFTEGYDPETLRAMLTVRMKPKPADPAVQPLQDGRLREKVRD
jgi:hypothetical protein